MAKRSTQQEFKGKGFEKPGDTFGGYLLKGNPKSKRPLDSKLPTHLVLRAIKGGMRLPKTLNSVNDIVFKTAKKHGITIYEYANVGNHLHILLRVLDLRVWAAFIRELTGRIAQYMHTKLDFDGSFWLYRPFTRIVRSWQKAYRDVKLYVHLNQLEAQGFIDRKQTKTLKDLRAIFDG